jgi:hypothetical protein
MIAKTPEILYEVFCNSKIENLSMENLLQYADEELQNFNSFLSAWISCLGEKTGETAERLFTEAVELTGDAEFQQQYAQKYADRHPGYTKCFLAASIILPEILIWRKRLKSEWTGSNGSVNHIWCAPILR